MKTIVTLLLFFSCSNLNAQKALKIGDQVPNLVFENIVNFNQKTATTENFKGKVIILDFWATWCGPCISSLAELEKLQSNLKAEVRVITVTDDPEERIRQFLTKKSINLPVVIDEKRKLAAYFPHRTIPHTVIIDKKGIVRAISESSNITNEIIRKVIDGQEIQIAEKKDVLDFDPSKPLSGNDNFSYQVTFMPYQEGYPSMSNPTGGNGIYKGRRILGTNLAAQSLFEIAYQFPIYTRTVVEVSNPKKFEWSKKNAVCFDLILPEELAARKFEIMRLHLEAYFDCKTHLEERIRPIKILRQINGKNGLLSQSLDTTEQSVQYSGKGLRMKKSNVSEIAEFIESMTNTAVLDETNLRGKYDADIAWYNENPAQIDQELKKIGLELVSEERKIKVLVIKDK